METSAHLSLKLLTKTVSGERNYHFYHVERNKKRTFLEQVTLRQKSVKVFFFKFVFNSFLNEFKIKISQIYFR